MSPMILFAPWSCPYRHNIVHIGSLTPPRRGMPIAVIAGTVYSNSYGSPVERSNRRLLLADPAIAPHVISLVGPDGYRALAYPAYLGPVPPCQSLADALERLDIDPELDMADVSNLTEELIAQAWSQEGRDVFRFALAKLLDGYIDPEHEHIPWLTGVPDAEIDKLWHEGAEDLVVRGGDGCTILPGCRVRFAVEEWCRFAAVSERMSEPRGHSTVSALRLLAAGTRIVAGEKASP